MKKQLTFSIVVLLGVIMAITVNAQDYKHPFGLVNKEGKVIDADGRQVGAITKEGVLTDTTGNRIAHVDANGNIVDTKTGKVVAHAPKNGTFVYYFKDAHDTLVIGEPLNGMCTVKNAKGETVMLVHENYKQMGGGCAVHCQRMTRKKKKTE